MRIEPVETRSTANLLTGAFETPIPNDLVIYDNTLREGEQPPGVRFSADEKLEMAQLMSDTGVHWANVGFPASSAAEWQGVNRICKAGLRMKTAALCRLKPEDIDRTVDAGVEMVALFVGGSDTHLFDKLRWTEERALDEAEAAITRCKERGVLASFAVEDGSRTPIERLLALYDRAEKAGADYMVFPDTLGVLTPESAAGITRLLAHRYEAHIGTHFHNDLGLALANTVSALRAGAKMAQVTVNGAGERCGNTCLEELLVLLHVKYGCDLGIDLSRLHELSQLVHRASGTEAPPHKPVVGGWTFTHESGIHVAGLLANPECYQPYPPATVGRAHEVVFGKHSGAAGVRRLAKELNLELSDDGVTEVLTRIKDHAEKHKGTVPEPRVFAWIRELSA
ncbi:MAG TPA: hypothetical protein RMG48_16010 [Myxococcales bacterium LLY-WYZ-16_1]|nr:hypothetical protein [Myxococcales bacterium LLY-WYZ-16_1]